MIQIEYTSVTGWAAAVRGMRNPMNSWDKSDTYEELKPIHYGNTVCGEIWELTIGNKDLDLMKKLVKAGTDHSKFMRMINVTCDITAPLYWWKEMDTYKVGTVRNSCSTMHTITNREFMKDDFSTENVLADVDHCDYIIGRLNYARKRYLETEGQEQKSYWYSIIQLLPSSYNQRATTQLNYQVLRNIYHARKDHKLNEWRDFRHWIETLPYSELITL
jgi:hypothetical protein